MTVFYPDEGKKLILDAITGVSPMGTLELREYTDDHTDNAADTEASFTDANYPGYSATTLTPAQFAQVIAANSTMTFPQQSSVSTSPTPQDVFGSYVVQQSTGTVLLSEKYTDGAKTVVSGGAPLEIDLVITFPG